MAVDWDEDVLRPLMSEDVFGEAVQPLYMPAAGGVIPIDGVFDNEFLEVDLLDDGAPGFSTRNPVLGIRLSQLRAKGVADALAGDKVQLQVLGVPTLYIVNQSKPDGKGWAKLELTLAATS